MHKIQIYLLLIIQVSVLGYYAWLRMDNADDVREPRTFGDTGEYFHNAGLPVLSSEFWTYLRPPGTALFWKFVGSDPDKIFDLQLCFSIVSWGILAFATSHALRTIILKPLIYLIVLGFSLSRDVFMWDPFLGSESIAFSLLALFLASSLWTLVEWKTYKVGVMILTALLMILTRDTFAYLLLMIAPVILLVFWIGGFRWKAAAVTLAFVLIFVISSELAERGLRPFRAILMNTSLRIYPSEIYTEYFRQHGMPVDERLVRLSRDPDPEDKFRVNKALLFDADQEKFRVWAMGPGRGEYIKFLWFYKADTFQKVFTETLGPSFYPDVYYYTATGYKPIIKDARIAEFLYPTRFGFVFFFAANLLAAFLLPIAWERRKRLWLLPLLMILLTYPQAVLIWAADVNDVARHSVAHNLLLRLGVWIQLFFLLDSIISYFPPRFSLFKKTSPMQEIKSVQN